MRIESIFYYNYTDKLGFYDSIRDFGKEEMRYIGTVISTPEFRVNASPCDYKINTEVSKEIRELVINLLPTLKEISKDLAVNSPRYIEFCYFDGSKKYFEYTKFIDVIFDTASKCKPEDVCVTIEVPNDMLIQPTTYTVPKSDNTYSQPKKSNEIRNFIIVILIMIILIPIIGIATKESVEDSAPESTVNYTTIPSGIKKSKSETFAEYVARTQGNFEDKETFSESGERKTPQKIHEPSTSQTLEGSQDYDGSTLKVTAPSNASCVVKLKTSDGETVLSFYVRAGETATAYVPYQKLYVFFATGETWYGREHLFGENTYYSKDDKIKDFYNYTYEYTLTPVTNGNFQETPINANEF